MSVSSRGCKAYFMGSADIETARVAEKYDVFAFCPGAPFLFQKPNALVVRREEKGNCDG
jgi:hypothetical protein